MQNYKRCREFVF